MVLGRRCARCGWVMGVGAPPGRDPVAVSSRGQGGRRPLRRHTRRIVLPGAARKDFLHPGQG